MSAGESRYHRQRQEAREHPNRKVKDQPHHDTTRRYAEVAAQIEAALAAFKQQVKR